MIPKSYKKKVSQINYPRVSIKHETRVYSKFVVFHFFGTLGPRPLARLISVHLSGRVDISHRESPGIASRHSKESNVNFIIEILTSRPSLFLEREFATQVKSINYHREFSLESDIEFKLIAPCDANAKLSWILEILKSPPSTPSILATSELSARLEVMKIIRWNFQIREVNLTFKGKEERRVEWIEYRNIRSFIFIQFTFFVISERENKAFVGVFVCLLHEVALFSSSLGRHFRRSKLKSKIQRHCYPRLKTEMGKKLRKQRKGKNTTMRPNTKYKSDFSYRISQLLSSLTRLHNVTRLAWHA